eukprot:UN00501
MDAQTQFENAESKLRQVEESLIIQNYEGFNPILKHDHKVTDAYNSQENILELGGVKTSEDVIELDEEINVKEVP